MSQQPHESGCDCRRCQEWEGDVNGVCPSCNEIITNGACYCGQRGAVNSSTDPKGEAGKDKCPLWLVPPKPLEETAFVHGLGAAKYGPWNWRKNKVCASTYISAILRHLNAWRSGEDLDPESGRSHLAHIAAGCFILMDAMLFGKLVDDRAK